MFNNKMFLCVFLFLLACLIPVSAEYINYSNSMSTGDLQNLSVVDPDGSCTYQWEITSGGGNLSALSGSQIKYEADSNNSYCNNNPTITLKCNGEPRDQISVAVYGGGGGGNAYEVEDVACAAAVPIGSQDCAGNTVTSGYGYSWTCCDKFIKCNGGSYLGVMGGCGSSTPNGCSGSNSCSVNNGFCDGVLSDNKDVSDVRSTQDKEDGCCPAFKYSSSDSYSGSRCTSDSECAGADSHCREDYDSDNLSYCAYDNKTCIHDGIAYEEGDISGSYKCFDGEWYNIVGSPLPSGDDFLEKDTNYANLGVDTSQGATCRYSSNPSLSYNDMTPMDQTGGTIHREVISGLQPGNDYSFCVKCWMDELNRLLDDFFVNFSVSNASSSEICMQDMQGYWTFDNVSGSTIYDSSGNANHATNNGSTQVSGKVGQAFDFDGSNDNIDTGMSISSEPITLSAWVNLDSVNRGDSLQFGNAWIYEYSHTYGVGFSSDKYGEDRSLPSDSTMFQLITDKDNGDFISIPNKADTWYFLTAAYDGSTMKLYKDGELYTSRSYSGGWTDPSQDFIIGGTKAYSDSYAYFTDGTIDEAAVWNRSLSADDIMDLYLYGVSDTEYCGNITDLIIFSSSIENNTVVGRDDGNNLELKTNKKAICKYSTSSGQSFSSMTSLDNTDSSSHNLTLDTIPGNDYNYYIKCMDVENGNILDYLLKFSVSRCPSGIVSYWTFDDDDIEGNTVYDSHGPNNGTNNGSLLNQTGLANEAVLFDGQDDYINFSDDGGFDFSAEDEFSISAWFKLGSDNDSNLINKRDGSDEGLTLWYDSEHGDGNKRMVFNTKDTGGSSSYKRGSTSIDLNIWYHILVVHNTDDDMKIYINGVEESYVTSSAAATGSYATNESLYIGGDVSRDFRYFNGSIDELAVFNTTLSSSTAERLYNLGMQGRGYCQHLLPETSNFTDPNSTDFSEVPDPTNVTNLSLCKGGQCIQFPNSSINSEGEDYDSNIITGDCFVSVNSTGLDSTFNTTSYLVMNNSDGHCGNDRIYERSGFHTNAHEIRKGDDRCINCEVIQRTNNFVTKFRVSHFTGYAIGSNTELILFDENESGSYSNGTDVTFFANYTNRTSGEHIGGADCKIWFDSDPTQYNMVEGSDNYNYTLTGGFSTGGEHFFYVNCTNNTGGWNWLNASDNFSIVGSAGPQPAIPEFSLLTLGLGLAAVLIGLFLFRRK